MKRRTPWARPLAAAVLATACAAQAALVDLGDGTVKDTLTDLIWLRDWNLNGLGTWGTQTAWAEGLEFAGKSDWRLPEMIEYEVLFGHYGNPGQLADFANVLQDTFYWSSSVVSPGVFSLAFDPVNNFMVGPEFQSNHHGAVAVRLDVVTTPVPEPATLMLAVLALLALGATTAPAARRQP